MGVWSLGVTFIKNHILKLANFVSSPKKQVQIRRRYLSRGGPWGTLTLMGRRKEERASRPRRNFLEER